MGRCATGAGRAPSQEHDSVRRRNPDGPLVTGVLPKAPEGRHTCRNRSNERGKLRSSGISYVRNAAKLLLRTANSIWATRLTWGVHEADAACYKYAGPDGPVPSDRKVFRVFCVFRGQHRFGFVQIAPSSPRGLHETDAACYKDAAPDGPVCLSKSVISFPPVKKVGAFVSISVH
jgi:hypothetical protein